MGETLGQDSDIVLRAEGSPQSHRASQSHRA